MKTDKPLYINLLWHMHQPYYKHPQTGDYILPWVRLHGIKDYYDMVTILKDFPEIRATFNIVPSLLKQIKDYVENDATDRYLMHTLMPADSLNLEDKIFILHNFFLANWDNMIKVYPRYNELLSKRGYNVVKGEIEKISRYFSTQDFLDLQVWFNLAWFDPLFRDKDPFISYLINKGRDFTEEEKRMLIERQKEILSLIIPEYRGAESSGQIELSTSPFYHPILPLLCDTNIAKVSMPDKDLPRIRFSYPEDAVEQIKRAVAYHHRIFGKRPKGMWPSEGAVSESIVPMVVDAGIEWIATDEEILSMSLGINIEKDLYGGAKNPDILYRPYRLKEGVSIFFRDHTLSDLIGFVYSKWDYKNAVADFISRLHKMHKNLSKIKGNHIVSIILDGENAWEYYKNDGRDFLLNLYEALSRDPLLKTVTPSGYLQENPPDTTIDRLFPGSWINHNFSIWIGHEEDNTAWEILSEAREAVDNFSKEILPSGDKDKRIEEALEEIYIVEGSDWCWWYGDEHISENAEEFDELYRRHLVNVYKILDKDVPPILLIPIIREDRRYIPTVEITGFISPIIDGEVSNYFEWLGAGFMDVRRYGGMMHRSEGILQHIYYGFNLSHLFLRLDPVRDFNYLSFPDLTFSITFLKPQMLSLDIDISTETMSVSATLSKYNNARKEKGVSFEIPSVAMKKILEIAVPFECLQAGENEEVAFLMVVKRNGMELEKYPFKGYISFRVPTPDFEAIMWHV